jgi:hypothetical protein
LSQIEGKVVTGHALSLNLENWKKLSPLNKLSLPWGEWPFDEDPNDPHRWFLFRPPFFGFDWTSFLGREGDFRINRDHIIDPAAGLVGNDVTMDVMMRVRSLMIGHGPRLKHTQLSALKPLARA